MPRKQRPGGKRGGTLIESITLEKARKCFWCGKNQVRGQVVLRSTNTSTGKVTAIFCNTECMDDVQYRKHYRKQTRLTTPAPKKTKSSEAVFFYINPTKYPHSFIKISVSSIISCHPKVRKLPCQASQEIRIIIKYTVYSVLYTFY